MCFKNKFIKCLLVMIMFFTINSLTVSAEDAELTNNEVLNLDFNGRTDEFAGHQIYKKTIGEHLAYCISGLGKLPEKGQCIEDYDILSSKERSVIGIILKNKCGDGQCASFGENYFLAEMAIIYYLKNNEYKHNDVLGFEINGTTADEKDYITKKIEPIIKDALKIADENLAIYKERNNFKVKLTTTAIENKNKYLEQEGNIYLYQEFTVKKMPYVDKNSVEIKTQGCSNCVIMDKKWDGEVLTFKVAIHENYVNENINMTLTVTAKQQTYYMGRVYDCDEGQDVVRLKTSNNSETATLTTTFYYIAPTITGTLTIEKRDYKTQELLNGATFLIEGPNGFYEMTTKNGIIYLKNLPLGTYMITELKAPDGYYITNRNYETELTEFQNNKTLPIYNEKNQIIISKTDFSGKNELPGALLEIQDKDGNIVRACTDAYGNKNLLCRWISTEEPYVTEGMPSGTYYLVEVSAPNGYLLNTERKEFKVIAGELGLRVTMPNKPIKVEISKISAPTKKHLPGATLEIQDKDGNVVKYCTDEKGNKGVECKWISTDKPYVIEGMPNGTYYLVETKSPKGYVLNKKKKEFIIDNTKQQDEVIKLEMINDLEVEVPDTLSTRSSLLLAIAMFDIALGIGIVTYVKKNKIKE